MHEFLLQFTVPIVINVTPYKVEDHMDKVVTEGDRSFWSSKTSTLSNTLKSVTKL